MVAPLVGLDMGQSIDAELIKRHQQRVDIQQQQHKQRQQKARDRAAQFAYDITRKRCTLACIDNAYLRAKNVKPFGALQLAHAVTLYGGKTLEVGTLVIPVFNGPLISSVQFINTDGQKMFLASGQIKGGMFPLCSQFDAKGVIYIGEGFATCAAVAEDKPESQVICAFNAGGLVEVAKIVRRSRPQAEIIILADNDISGAGEYFARQAAIAANGSYIMPEVSA